MSLMAARSLYRLRQFTGYLLGNPDEDELRGVQNVLSSQEYALFLSMSPGDQEHGLRVWRALCSSGRCPPALAKAALLHDVGKAGCGLGPLGRSLCVVLRRLAPRLLASLAEEGSAWWGSRFRAYLDHAAIGAGRCALAGSPAETVALVRYHDSDEPQDLSDAIQDMLLALRTADDES